MRPLTKTMKLSIALATYNGTLYLKEQLESIAAQTRTPDELVISDDQSTDDTLRLIEEFGATADFPVRLSVNESNLGTAKNFEKAISLCRGEVILLSDQDDVWHSDKLESVERIFEARPELSLVFSNAELVDESLRRVDETLFDLVDFNPEKQRLVKSGRALDLQLRENLFLGCTMAFRANLKKLILPISATGPLVHDGWIMLLVAAVGEIDFINRPLVKYRQHPAQQCRAGDSTTWHDIMTSPKIDRASRVRQATQLNEAFERLAAYGLSQDKERLLRDKVLYLHERAGLPVPHFQRSRSVGRKSPLFQRPLKRGQGSSRLRVPADV
jgi:glycosyltransferase involved in cell wall biosynthesis